MWEVDELADTNNSWTMRRHNGGDRDGKRHIGTQRRQTERKTMKKRWN